MNDIKSLIIFQGFPKIARLSREIIVTEKIDGTNAQICITEDGQMLVGSRTQWITPKYDNYGFAAWADAHRDELLRLGPGRHFGEWWGQGIQRKYGLTEKRWSLFNASRWCLAGETPQRILMADPRIEKYQEVLPACCSLVPVLYRGLFTTEACEAALADLRENGSKAAPGFKSPEGIVIFHVHANVGFKKTLEHDQEHKGARAQNQKGSNIMNGWKQYKRKGLSEMRPYVAGEDMAQVSISEPDKQNGSPKEGDMIARNPKNHADQWLVAKKYFEENLEPA